MSGLIGKKVGMTSLFDANGKNIPCTVIQAGPCVVTQVKTEKTDGYNAVQIAYNEKSGKNIGAPLKGHFKKAGVNPHAKLVEFKSFKDEKSLGDSITVDLFDGDPASANKFTLFNVVDIAANASTQLLTEPLIMLENEVLQVTAADAGRLFATASILEINREDT